jgi:hypothetical protein
MLTRALLFLTLALSFGCSATGSYELSVDSVAPLPSDPEGTERLAIAITASGGHALGVWLEHADGSDAEIGISSATAFLHDRGTATHLVHVVSEPHPDTPLLRRLRLVGVEGELRSPTRDALLEGAARLSPRSVTERLSCEAPTHVVSAGDSYRVMARVVYDATPSAGGATITPPE